MTHHRTKCAHIKLGQTSYSSLFPWNQWLSMALTPQTHQILITQQIGSMEQISKQGTSQKRQLWETRYQIDTLYTELTFPKIANWFRCFPRLLWIRRKFHMWKAVVELRGILVYFCNDGKTAKQFQILVWFWCHLPTIAVSTHMEPRTGRAAQLFDTR